MGFVLMAALSVAAVASEPVGAPDPQAKPRQECYIDESTVSRLKRKICVTVPPKKEAPPKADASPGKAVKPGENP